MNDCPRRRRRRTSSGDQLWTEWIENGRDLGASSARGAQRGHLDPAELRDYAQLASPRLRGGWTPTGGRHVGLARRAVSGGSAPPAPRARRSAGRARKARLGEPYGVVVVVVLVVVVVVVLLVVVDVTIVMVVVVAELQ